MQIGLSVRVAWRKFPFRCNGLFRYKLVFLDIVHPETQGKKAKLILIRS